MSKIFDIYDWSVRRAMLLLGLLMAVTVTVALLAPMWIVMAIIFIILLLFSFRRMRRIVPLFCAVVAILGFTCGMTYRALRVEPLVALDSCMDTVTGVVIDCPRSGNMYTIRVTDGELLPRNTNILLYCSDLVAPSLYDEVTATVEYRSLYDSQLYHRANDVYLQAFPTTFGENCVLSHPLDNTDWVTALRPLRSKLTRSVTSMLTGDEGGLLAAVCFGDKSRLSYPVTDAFRASGLSHLLAVSGLHMSVIAGGMFVLMRVLRVKRLAGNLLTAVVILLFMWIVEFTPSVTRAGVMYLVLIFGRMTRFQCDSLNSLGLALTLILVVSPSSVYDVGLWLSFTATVGVLCVSPRLFAPLMRPFESAPPLVYKPIKWVVTCISVSVGCTLPITPLMMLFFGEMSLVSPVTNLLTVLPSGWMMTLGCVGSLLTLIPPVAFFGRGLMVLAGLVAKWLIAVSDFCASIPGVVLRPSALWLLFFIAAGGVIVTVAIVRLPFRQVCVTLCVMLVATIVALPIHSSLMADRCSVAFATDSHGTVAVVDSADGAVAMMNSAASIYTLHSLMDQLRIDELECLVVNQCKTAHEAYLADFKRECSSVSIACVEDVLEAEWLDCSLSHADWIRFDEQRSLDVSVGSWLLSVGESRLYLSMSRTAGMPPEFGDGDMALVYADKLVGSCTLDAGAVFCSADSEKYTVSESEGLYVISNDEPVFVTTTGDGQWKWMRRVFGVLA